MQNYNVKTAKLLKEGKPKMEKHFMFMKQKTTLLK